MAPSETDTQGHPNSSIKKTGDKENISPLRLGERSNGGVTGYTREANRVKLVKNVDRRLRKGENVRLHISDPQPCPPGRSFRAVIIK